MLMASYICHLVAKSDEKWGGFEEPRRCFEPPGGRLRVTWSISEQSLCCLWDVLGPCGAVLDSLMRDDGGASFLLALL